MVGNIESTNNSKNSSPRNSRIANIKKVYYVEILDVF